MTKVEVELYDDDDLAGERMVDRLRRVTMEVRVEYRYVVSIETPYAAEDFRKGCVSWLEELVRERPTWERYPDAVAAEQMELLSVEE